MKIEDQVCSLELAKRLKELGVKQESYFYHVEPCPSHGNPEWRIIDAPPSHVHEWYSAFTVAEMGEMLPVEYNQGVVQGVGLGFMKEHNYWAVFCPTIVFRGKTEADARAKMLCYLLEKKLILVKAIG